MADVIYRDGTELPFLVQLTAYSAGFYAWTEVQPSNSTTLVTMTSGRSGTVTVAPAYDPNGAVVPVPSYAFIQRSYYNPTNDWVYVMVTRLAVASDSALTNTTGTFVIPAVGLTANVTTTSTAGMAVNDFISITDGTNIVYGYVQSITNPTTFVFKTAFVTAGAAGNTMAVSAIIHICCKVPFLSLTTATFVIPTYNTGVTVNVEKTTGLKNGMEVMIDDGTNVVYGYVSGLAATSFTFTTTMIAAGAAGNTMSGIATVLPATTPLKTPTTATFVIPALGSPVTVTTGSTGWMTPNMDVMVYDQTNTIYGTAVPVTATTFTFYPKLITSGAVGNTVPVYSTVVPTATPPKIPTTVSFTLPAVGTGVTVTVPTTTPYKTNDLVYIDDGTNKVYGYVTILTGTTFTFTPTFYQAGIPTNTMLVQAIVTPIYESINYLLGKPSLATNAIIGFPYFPGTAGTPTGVPTLLPTGFIPLVIDSTNSKLYGYIGGAWVDLSPASGGGGANTALSNLASVAINTSLISDTDNNDDLGSPTTKWNHVYTTFLYTGSGLSAGLTIGGYDSGLVGWRPFIVVTEGNPAACDLKAAVTQEGETIYRDSASFTVPKAKGGTGADNTTQTYTPTRSAEANLDSSVTMSQAQYARVGSLVTVSGEFTADPTTPAGATSFEFTLPIASNIGATSDLAGTAFCGAIAGQGAQIRGVVANDTAKVTWIAADVTSQTWSYTLVYRVI